MGFEARRKWGLSQGLIVLNCDDTGMQGYSFNRNFEIYVTFTSHLAQNRGGQQFL
jgi:hypothetical protein